MKSVSALFLVCAISFLSCSKEKEKNEDPLITNGLVSFYTFHGNCDDVFGDNNGEDYHIDYDTINNQQENLFLKLNGINSFVNFPDTFDYQNRTINLWFNVNEATPDLTIIYCSDNPGLNYGLTILSTQLINSQPVLIYNISNKLDTIEIDLHTWYNATLVAKGMSYAYYLNNNKFSAGTIDMYISSYNGIHAAIIGCNRTLSTRFFNGLVDNLRIYNRNLSENEISVLYNTELKRY